MDCTANTLTLLTKMEKITIVECPVYLEDSSVCDSEGETKGQCRNCGAKWYEHDLNALPILEQQGAREIQEYRGVN